MAQGRACQTHWARADGPQPGGARGHQAPGHEDHDSDEDRAEGEMLVVVQPGEELRQGGEDKTERPYEEADAGEHRQIALHRPVIDVAEMHGRRDDPEAERKDCGKARKAAVEPHGDQTADENRK